VRQKKDTIAKSIGDAPLWTEKWLEVRNAKIRTPTHAKNPVTIETRIMSKKPIRSIFGGQSTSSNESVKSLKELFWSSCIVVNQYKNYSC
jgi:hypothetical protein